MNDPQQHRQQVFPRTQWSLVLRAQATESESVAQEAMSELCQRYWQPLYVFVRSHGHSPADCEDYVQAFFERVLRLDSLKSIDPAKGRLRSFLLQSMRHFLSSTIRKAETLKRGGKCFHMDIDQAEAEFHADFRDLDSPDKAFDRRWAIQLVNQTMGKLQSEFDAKSETQMFQQLEPLLAGTTDQSYADVAKALDTTEGAIKLRVFRMRKRYRKLLHEEISQTVAGRQAWEAEVAALRDLF